MGVTAETQPANLNRRPSERQGAPAEWTARPNGSGPGRPEPGVQTSAVGLWLDENMSYDSWRAVGARIARQADASSWWLGDWIIFGEKRYGSRYSAAIERSRLDYKTLRNYAVVTKRFTVSRRRDNLSFQHHAEVCSLSDAEQDHWLDLAAANGWSKTELRGHLRQARSAAGERGFVLRVNVDSTHGSRWSEAAALCECDVHQWVVQALDAAAEAVLGPPTTFTDAANRTVVVA